MEKRKLGNSDMNITRIGLGAWAIGGNWQWGWGPQDDKDSIKTILKALELGINWIDTAAVYGLGRSEEVVGEAIKEVSSKPYIFTKCGFRWKEINPKGKVFPKLKAASIREEAENSLRRLKIDVIDLYQMHWPNPPEDIEEAWTEMAKLKEEGKVRWIGVSNHNREQMEKLNKISPVTTLQPPYHLLDRHIETDILPYCSDKNIGTIVYSPMASGLLTGKMTRERIKALPNDDWRKQDAKYREPQLTENLAFVERLKKIAESKNVSTAEIAIAWTLKNPAVTAAIVGMRRPDQPDGIIRGADITLTEEDIRFIEQS
jgi:aryl-alcohol dehydrogenase-like predicted oxidoreductase